MSLEKIGTERSERLTLLYEIREIAEGKIKGVFVEIDKSAVHS